MRNALLLVLGAVLVFGAVALIMIKLMPEPLDSSDYLVIGSVATLMAMLALFLMLISTRLKANDVFFKKRKKQP